MLDLGQTAALLMGTHWLLQAQPAAGDRILVVCCDIKAVTCTAAAPAIVAPWLIVLPCLLVPDCPYQVFAQAYDNPIPGFQTPTVSNLRLWDALPVTEFDLAAFNAGDYDKVRGCRQGCAAELLGD